MALVPETARLPDAQRAVRMALAEIVYQNGSQTKKDSKYDLLDPGWLFCAQPEGARMPGIRAHLRAKAAERAKTLAESRSVLANAAVRLYHYERGGSLASAELVKLQLRGDPKYVRGVYTRMAHALVTGDLDFVRRRVADPGAFSARTLRRAAAARAHRSGGCRAGSDELARLAPRAPRQEQPQAQGHDAGRARPLPDGRGGRERLPASAGASRPAQPRAVCRAAAGDIARGPYARRPRATCGRSRPRPRPRPRPPRPRPAEVGGASTRAWRS